VLVFDQLNDPQFRRRLSGPFFGGYRPRLLTTKGVEQTALVIEMSMEERDGIIEQNEFVYISDLVNDFKEINESNILQYMEYGYEHCIGVHGEMYRTEANRKGGDSYSLAASFDGERFLFNESKVDKFDLTDFKRAESASCLPYHMVENNGSPFNIYCQLMNATDTKLLWLIRSPRKCENRNCPIQEGFYLLVEQDFLVSTFATFT